MRIAWLLAVVAGVASACRSAPVAAVPDAVVVADAAPVLRLVGCAPALPLPRTGTELGSARSAGGEPSYGPIDYATLARQRSHPAAAPGAPSVIAGSPTVSGSLDRAVVERLVRSHLAELRACYVRDLATDPAMAGTVTVTFVAGPDGKVTTTSVLGTGVSPAVSACAARVVQALQFPTGQTISVSYPFQFATGAERVALPHDTPTLGLHPDAPWTPFALGDDAPPRTAPLVARAAEAAIRRGFASIAGCFSGPAPVGSLRAMLAIRGDGSIDSARAGGIAHPAEACVARRLLALRVAAPVHDAAEIACDFARGDARPWRVAPSAGYAVVEASRRGVRHGAAQVTPGALAPRALPADQTFLVIAGPDTPGAMLELALEWTEQGDATLLALRDGPGPPRLIGVARTAHQVGGIERVTAWPALRIGGGAVTACVDRASQRARLADPVAVDDLVQRAAARCRTLRCSASLGIGIDPDATASQLLDVAGAARRAGFERVLLGSYSGCAAARPARR